MDDPQFQSRTLARNRTGASARLLSSLLLVLQAASAQITGASQILSNASGENSRYTGIGRFIANSTCTAFLIDAALSPTTETPAYVATSGHCLPERGANDVVTNKPLTNARVVFNFFKDTQDRQLTVPAIATAYSSMKGVDIAIVQLGSSYQELVSSGIVPVKLHTNPPQPDEKAVFVGAPATDIPRNDAFLRRSECTLGPPVNLIEFVWHFWSALPNTCSDVKGGASGSPVISESTGAAVAIMNTTTAGAVTDTGDFPCYVNQPCEIANGAVEYKRDTNYAVPLNGLQSCFSADGIFELAKSGCPLDPGKQLQLSAPERANQPLVDSGTGERVPPRWNVEVTGDAYTYYRHKIVKESAGGDCRDSQGYGNSVKLSEKPLIDEEIPQETDRYYLCVLGGNSPEVNETWQSPQFASMVHTRIDNTAPTIEITYQLRDAEQAYVLVPYFVLPELVWFEYKLDTGAESTCDNPEGYRIYNRVPIRIPKDSGVYRVCLWGADEAGNRTATLELPVHGTSVRPDGAVNAASLATGALTRSSILTILGVNLAAEATTAPESEPVTGLGSMSVELTDSAGVRTSLPLYYVGRDQINAFVPDQVATGPAQIDILGPNGPAQVPIAIGDRHPGLFTAAGGGFGPPAGVAIRTSAGMETQEPLFQCTQSASCSPKDVELPKPDESLTLVLPVTGIADTAADELDLRIGGIRIPVSSVEAGPAAGVQTLHGSIGAEFRLRGYLPLTLTVAGKTSNRLFVLFR